MEPIEKALKFIDEHQKKSINPFAKYEEIILTMRNKKATYRIILEFILTQDEALNKEYITKKKKAVGLVQIGRIAKTKKQKKGVDKKVEVKKEIGDLTLKDKSPKVEQKVDSGIIPKSKKIVIGPQSPVKIEKFDFSKWEDEES